MPHSCVLANSLATFLAQVFKLREEEGGGHLGAP